MTKYIVILFACLVAAFLFMKRGEQPAPVVVSGAAKDASGQPVKLVGQYFCPIASVIAPRLNREGGFRFLRLDWSVDRIPARYTGGLRFSQAVFSKSRNDLICNYEWPNQDSANTWIVVAVHLIPNAALSVIPRGKLWNQSGSTLLCSHHAPKNCTFDLQRKKRQ